MKCKICGSEVKPLFAAEVLQKYKVKYYHCQNCDFIQTEDPYWLDEAYGNAITDLDIGLVERNLEYSNIIDSIIKSNFDYKKKFIDYAGGYGLFVRLMRDKGFNFYRQDKYCENIFANHFDIKDLPQKSKFELLTAFEVFEHLVDPLEEIKKMLEVSDTIIFSTELHPDNLKDIKDWWYFSPEIGQHVSFYSLKTLNTIAHKFGLSVFSKGNLHLITKREFKLNPLVLKNVGSVNLKSLTQDDYELVKKFIKELYQNNKQYSKISGTQKNKIILEKLSLIESRLNLTEGKLNEKNKLVEELSLGVEEREKDLQKMSQDLGISNAELSRIYSSRGWKLLTSAQKILRRVLPSGSRRRKIVFLFLRVLRKALRLPIKAWEAISNNFYVFDKIAGPHQKRKINKSSKKIVYIGHSYHVKTQSTAFLINYLKEFYDVDVIEDESWLGKPVPDLSFIDESYLGVIFFQNFPKKETIEQINNTNIIFFPMYDAHVDHKYSYWRNYKNVKVMNFSSTLNKKHQKWGLQSEYIQYFPQPSDYFEGNKNEAFFWQRITGININSISRILDRKDLRIHLHKAVDPNQKFIQPTKEQEKRLKITYSDWFEKREQMWNLIKEKAIYVAPREYEGIGMSFLEAMAMGKAVIAVNNPTMNEYIVNNKTGYLFDLKNPKKIDLSNLREVQKNTYEYMQEGYKKWENEKHKIIEFIESE